MGGKPPQITHRFRRGGIQGKTGENWPGGQYELQGFYIATKFDTAKMFAQKRGENLPSTYSKEEKRLAVVEVFIPKCVFLPETIIPAFSMDDVVTDEDWNLVGSTFKTIAPLSGFKVNNEAKPWTGSSSFGNKKPSEGATIKNYGVLGVQGSIQGWYPSTHGTQIFIAKVGCKWLRFGNAQII